MITAAAAAAACARFHFHSCKIQVDKILVSFFTAYAVQNFYNRLERSLTTANLQTKSVPQSQVENMVGGKFEWIYTDLHRIAERDSPTAAPSMSVSESVIVGALARLRVQQQNGRH